MDPRPGRRRPSGEAWPLYIGDDLTDEDGFRAVKGLGLSVAASPRAAGADFAVDGPQEVEAASSRGGGRP